jgi:hypothetical protein
MIKEMGASFVLPSDLVVRFDGLISERKTVERHLSTRAYNNCDVTVRQSSHIMVFAQINGVKIASGRDF